MTQSYPYLSQPTLMIRFFQLIFLFHRMFQHKGYKFVQAKLNQDKRLSQQIIPRIQGNLKIRD